MEVTGDEFSLFRSASRITFQDEKYWFILKIGSIANGIAMEKFLIEKAGYCFNLITLLGL